MNKEEKKRALAFGRSKESMRDVVNFRDPRGKLLPTAIKEEKPKKGSAFRARGEGSINQFVKHIGTVKYVGKGPIETVVTTT